MIETIVICVAGFLFFAFRDEYQKELEKRTGKKRKKEKKIFTWDAPHSKNSPTGGYFY